jgi:mRNA-degrading endonuclease RelE of RelBE toxin-antitoxin system
MSLDSSYKVLADKRFNKFVRKKLPSNLKAALDKKIEFLSKNPFYNSLNTKKLQVSVQKLKELEVDEVYEFYINMGFRCVFYVVNTTKTIILAKVGNHEDVDGWFPH